MLEKCKSCIARVTHTMSNMDVYDECVLYQYPCDMMTKCEYTIMHDSEVQPIVHCKDCKYRKEHHYEDKGEAPYIKYSCKFTTYSMNDNGFCSIGMIKEGENK